MAWFVMWVHYFKIASCLVCPADQTFGITSGQSQRGRDVAGTQSTAQEQLQGAAQWGETSPLLTVPPPQSAGISILTESGKELLRWEVESGLRSEGSWGSVAPAALCSQLTKPLCIEKKTGWQAAHRQERIRSVTQHQLVGLALLKA